MRIRVWTQSTGFIEAEIIENKNPVASKAVKDALPIEGIVNIWGDEIYFSSSIHAERENSSAMAEVGDIAQIPRISGICIFFGKTPMSVDQKPVAASPVNVVGRIIGDPTVLRKAKDGEKIRIEKSEDM